jgi:hypothetical protein
VFKYFLYKGGYITGFGGTANPINVVYDFISIGFRFLIIKNLISQTRLKIIGALLISTLIVAIKINVFAFPLFLKIMWELEDKRTEEQRIQLLGNFSGTIRQLSTHQEKPIKLSIDSNLLSIGMEPPFNLKEKYNFNLNYFSYGEIGTKNGLEYEILIEKINDDSLVMKFTDFYKEKYKLRLKTER